MSAIAGLVSKKSIKGASEIVKKMCDIQSHRGPHGEGQFKNDNVCLGHRALHLKENGKRIQEPLVNRSKRVIITCDGSIYNAEALRKDLTERGYQFKSGSDSELILHLYEEMGIKCLDDLRGDFAFAVWDDRLKKIFIARDRFGIKPLFYSYNHEGTLLFASELKALIKSGLVDREIDHEAIYHYLFYTFFHQPQTPLKSIRSLVPGHYIAFDPGKNTFEIVQYWDVPFSTNRTEDEEFLITGFRRILDESISLRIENDASIAISLSGGIDSSFIAAKISNTGYPLKTFTFGFKGEGEEYNEFKHARDVAESIGSEHHEFNISARDIYDHLPKMIWHLETPTSGIILPYFLAKTAGENNINLTFKGDGAHSIFESPEEKKFVMVQKFFSILNILPNPIKKKMCNKIEFFLNLFAPYYRSSNSNLTWATHILSKYFKAITGKRNLDLLFSEKERKDMFLEPFWRNRDFKETSEIVLEIMEEITTKDVREKMIYEEYKRFPDQALMYITNVHAAFSAECRQPYWDHKLAEFSQRHLPLSLRRKNDINKYILKKVCRSTLPNEIIDRPQHGFYMPIHRWLRKELKPVVDDVFSRESVKRRGIFKYSMIKSIYNQYYSAPRKTVSWRKIWSLVALEIWFRAFYDPNDIESP